MSKIPYYFETPIPNYFIKNNWFKPDPSGKHFKRMFFIQWCFSRCSTVKRTIFFLNKSIDLEPYEFIFGRNICSQETGLTEQEIRTLINQLNSIHSSPTLEKSTSKSTNKYTVYRWNTSHFKDSNNQQNNQQPTSSQPADNHKLEQEIFRSETSTHTLKKSKTRVVVSQETKQKLKLLDLSDYEIESVCQYSESRILLAIEFVTSPHTVIQTTFIQTIIWHCKKEKPPQISFDKSLSPQISETKKYIQFLKDNDFHKAAKRCEETFNQGIVTCLLDGEAKTINYKNAEINALKKDFKLSIEELECLKIAKQKTK